MRVYCLFFLIALCGADDTTTTTSTATTAATSATSTATAAVSSAISAASNFTVGGLLGKINSTASSILNGKHNIITKGVELGNLTAHGMIGLGAHALGNATEMAQKGVDVALNMGLQSMQVGRQVMNKTMEIMTALPGSKYLPISTISNATSFGMGLGEKGLNASMSAMKNAMQMGNNIGQTMANKTMSVVSGVHDNVVKVHQKATNLAIGVVNSTVSNMSNKMQNVGKWLTNFGNRINKSATITG